MKNTLPQQLDRLFTLGEDMAVGCQSLDATIGILHNKEVNVRADLAAAQTAHDAYLAAKTGKRNAVRAQKLTDGAASIFIIAARDVLKRHLGTSWSQMWEEAGFANSSFALPDALVDRLALLGNLSTYLSAHGEYEAAPLGVTADAADSRHAALSGARAAVLACRADVGTKRAARDAALRTLRKRMRGLITELEQLLPGDDARWRMFGLNPPNGVGLPEVPEGLTVIGGGSGHLLAHWETAPLAARYRVFKKVVGVDNEFVFAATVTDTESNLNTFTPGVAVRVRVTAVNDAGESLPSDSVEQLVP